MLVLFDRDGTLVEDVPYNGDAELVVLVGVATNQSGIGRGLVTAAQVEAMNARVELLLGPFDVWQVCPHAPEDGCRCGRICTGRATELLEAGRSVLWQQILHLGDDIARLTDRDAPTARHISELSNALMTAHLPAPGARSPGGVRTTPSTTHRRWLSPSRR